jgi:hypothetical protein
MRNKTKTIIQVPKKNKKQKTHNNNKKETNTGNT